MTNPRSSTSQKSNSSVKVSVRKKSPKKPKCLPLLVALRPTNLLEEKEKFFERKCRYDPQFEYSRLDSEAAENYGSVSTTYLPQALKIVQTGLKKFGSFSNWEKGSGGEIMSRAEVHDYITDYLRMENMEYEIVINITPKLLSHASMTKVKGKPTINIKEDKTHRNWINGMLNHEIGTHYIRAYNNARQPWRTKKRRRKFRMNPANPTEEGIASLNTQICREEPLLMRSALMYYVVYLASRLSFSQAYATLREFIDCPEARWSYLMRAKRGQTDTSRPGCFPKDQVYLTGALQILRNRHSIDFEKLYRFGKIDYRDIEKLEPHVSTAGTRLPAFVSDLPAYLEKLEYIMTYNELTDTNILPIATEQQKLSSAAR